MPEIFNDLEQFEVWYSASMLHRDSLKAKIIQKESEKKILEKFHQIIRTLMLRRTKRNSIKNNNYFYYFLRGSYFKKFFLMNAGPAAIEPS